MMTYRLATVKDIQHYSNPMFSTLTLNWTDRLVNFFKLKEASQNARALKLERTSTLDNNNFDLKNQTILEQLTVGIFFHYRDVKVVLDDLNHAGFPLNSLTLIARNCQRHHWLSELNIFSHFKTEFFSFSQECEQFFQRVFRRGQYILVVQGTEDMTDFAAQILSRRREHSNVWYLNKQS